MPCFHPLEGYQAVDPRRPQGLMFNPSIQFPTRKLKVPCGRCKGCRIDYSRDWGTRLYHHNTTVEASSFHTFTFDDDHLPDDYSVSRTDIPALMKTYRNWLAKYSPDTRIQYFNAAEYGELTSRPHYHAMIFGHRMPDLVPFAAKSKHPLYLSPTLTELWGKGNVITAEVTPESCNYVAGYMLKDMRNGDWRDEYRYIHPLTGELVQRVAPFATMSTKPGIGRRFYDQYKRDLFPSGFIVVNGKKRPVPEYYIRLLKEDDPEEYVRQMEIRRRALTDPNFKWNNTPERLAVREVCAAARCSQRKRDKD